jgi:integrase
MVSTTNYGTGSLAAQVLASTAEVEALRATLARQTEILQSISDQYRVPPVPALHMVAREGHIDLESQQSARLRESYSLYHDFMRSFRPTGGEWFRSNDASRLARGMSGLVDEVYDGPSKGSSGTNITFVDLIAERSGLVESGKLPKRSFDNDRTSIKKFKTRFGLTDESAVLPYFGGHFEEYRERFLATIPSGSVASHRTRLTNWQTTFHQIQAKLNGNRPLHEVLREKLGAPDVEGYAQRLAAIAKSTAITLEQLEKWVSGKTFPTDRPATRVKITALEQNLEFEPDSLLSKISRSKISRYRSRNEESRAIPASGVFSRRQIHRVLSNVRIVPLKMSSDVQGFLQHLVEFKSGMGLCFDKSGQGLVDRPKKNSSWGAETADFNMAKLRSMVAWLCLPSDENGARKVLATAKLNELPGPELSAVVEPMFRGKGIPSTKVKVCDLLNPANISGYLAWRTLRSQGEVHEGHSKFLKMMKALLAPKYGFVTQQPELAWGFQGLGFQGLKQASKTFKQDYSEQKKLWADQCSQWHDQLATLSGRVMAKQDEGVPRGPKHDLEPISTLNDPLSVLINLIDRHGKGRPPGFPGRPTQTTREVIWLRDQTLLRLILSNPLRNRNLRDMTWRSDNTGNLYQKEEEWWIRFSRNEIKNGGGKKGAYDVQVIADLVPYLNAYLKSGENFGRGFLIKKGGKHADRVFLTNRGTRFAAAPNLSQLFARLTEGHLEDLPGSKPFRSHAWRHIVATGYLKSTRDFVTLSFILHDRLQTVLDHYAHLVPQDGFDTYSRWLGKRTARINFRDPQPAMEIT